MTELIPSTPRHRAAMVTCAALFLAGFAMWSARSALAQDFQAQLSEKRSHLAQDRSRQAELSTALERYSSEIDRLAAEVATLRDREAKVQHQLVVNEAQLKRAMARLARVRTRLHAALKVLSQRLVATYETPPLDAVNVILSSRGFDQLSSRYEYLSSIEHRDASIVATVRRLRNETRDTVNRIQAARDRLVSRRAELAGTRNQVQSRVSELATAHDRKQRLLSGVSSNGAQLQREISAIQGRIQAAQAAQAPPPSASGLTEGATTPGASLGPVPAGQAISPFPASSPVTWGRTDQGVDGTTTPGSPLLAMGSGTVTIGHDPGGFGASYPILSTSFGDFYYGHCVPIVGDGASVSIGQPIATAHYGTWGNSTTPGGFEIGAWPPGDMTAGGAIRSWLIGLPRR
jgi:peptidoglycan hydrolase CwlO-like protein